MTGLRQTVRRVGWPKSTHSGLIDQENPDAEQRTSPRANGVDRRLPPVAGRAGPRRGGRARGHARARNARCRLAALARSRYSERVRRTLRLRLRLRLCLSGPCSGSFFLSSAATCSIGVPGCCVPCDQCGAAAAQLTVWMHWRGMARGPKRYWPCQRATWMMPRSPLSAASSQAPCPHNPMLCDAACWA